VARKLEIEYERASGGDRTKATNRDASLGGLFIETKKPLENGELVTLELSSPGGMKVVVDARVIAVQAADLGPDKAAGMAVRFLDLPDGAAGTLGPMFQASRPPARTYLGVGATEQAIPKAPSLPKMMAVPAASQAPMPPPPPQPAPPPPVHVQTPQMPIASPPASVPPSFAPAPMGMMPPQSAPRPHFAPLPQMPMAPRRTSPLVWIVLALLVIAVLGTAVTAVLILI